MLAVTFQGPFAFCIEPRSVNVFAPICDNHHAAVFTVHREYPLCGRHKMGGDYSYALTGGGIQNNLGDINFNSGNPNLVLGTPSGSSVDRSQAKLCINVPRPASIYGISPAHTEVVTGTPTGRLQDYATGLRFFYNCDFAYGISMRTPESTDMDLLLDGLPSLPAYGDIEIRHVGPDADDAEHSDALACFDKTMNLFNLPWWLNYGQAVKRISILTRTGSDCKSVIVVSGGS